MMTVTNNLALFLQFDFWQVLYVYFIWKISPFSAVGISWYLWPGPSKGWGRGKIPRAPQCLGALPSARNRQNVLFWKEKFKNFSPEGPRENVWGASRECFRGPCCGSQRACHWHSGWCLLMWNLHAVLTDVMWYGQHSGDGADISWPCDCCARLNRGHVKSWGRNICSASRVPWKRLYGTDWCFACAITLPCNVLARENAYTW